MHRKGDRFFYVTSTTPRKWVPLGDDINEARRQWAKLEGETENPADKTFSVIIRRYKREVLPTKAATDTGDLALAQRLLGHKTPAT